MRFSRLLGCPHMRGSTVHTTRLKVKPRTHHFGTTRPQIKHRKKKLNEKIYFTQTPDEN